uniref:Uncharacterized protein n=1 Tax=Nothoprocta perdicaria TaxID=30464 RepID=A0A8C6Z1G3_NOTPE
MQRRNYIKLFSWLDISKSSWLSWAPRNRIHLRGETRREGSFLNSGRIRRKYQVLKGSLI